MKKNLLRNIYPKLPQNIKSVKWRRLTDEELTKSMKQPQIIANCYDEATRYALLASKKGREMFRNRIWIEKDTYLPAYKIKMNINGKDELYRTTNNDYWGRYSHITEHYWNDNPYSYKNRLSLGINIAVNKMIEKHPFMKPIISRFYLLGLGGNYGCELNKPSNAFKWFTGKNPEQIGESGININLVNNKNKVLETLGRLKRKTAKDYSYVAITGPFGIKVRNINSDKTKIDAWHCLPIIQVSKNNVYMKNLRTNEVLKVSYDEFLKKFKGLVGLDH